jgi:hypothetical protein
MIKGRAELPNDVIVGEIGGDDYKDAVFLIEAMEKLVIRDLRRSLRVNDKETFGEWAERLLIDSDPRGRMWRLYIYDTFGVDLG